MDSTFLGYLMNSQLVRKQLNKYGTGATVMHIYQSDLKKIKIPDLKLDKQIELGEMFEELAGNINLTESKINSLKALQKSPINQVF